MKRRFLCIIPCLTLWISSPLILGPSSLFGQPSPDLLGARLFKSGPVQTSADGRWVWMVNPDNDSVSRYDTVAIDRLTEMVLPSGTRHHPKGLSLREDGSEVWVACHDSDKVFVLNPNDGSVLTEINLPWGSGPYSIALSPDQSIALVTLHRAESVAILDTASHTVKQILAETFWAPMGIAWTDEGQSAWINHLFAPGEHPLQTRLDFTSDPPQISASIRITPADPRNSTRLTAPYNVAEGGYLNIRGHAAQIPLASGRGELWLPTQYHNISEEIYTPDSTMQVAIRHIDLASKTLLAENRDKVILTAKYVHTPTATGAYEGPGWDAHIAGPVDLAFSANGHTAFLLNELSNDLVIFPTDTPAVKPGNASPLPEIPVGHRPIGLALSPTRPEAYVYNQFSRDLSVIDLTTQTEIRRVPATPITGEPYSPSVLQGAKLFHTSDDPRISANSKVSCASCHINGEHDGRTWSFHRLPGKHGPRSVPSLLGMNLSFGPRDPVTGWGQIHRSGDRDEIQDFDHTFQGIQMGGTGFLGNQVHPELGEPNAGRDPDLDAIADYLLFLSPLKRSPFRTLEGNLTEAAIRGATLFAGNDLNRQTADANCATCHIPESGFVDFKFHDVGQRREANEEEINSRTPAWHVNTPTLVGVWATPPYSGMANFAESHHAHGSMIGFLLDTARRPANTPSHGRTQNLTQRQLLDLAEFVLSIDGNMTAQEVREARDTLPPRLLRIEPTSLTSISLWFSESLDPVSAQNLENWLLTELPPPASPHRLPVSIPLTQAVLNGLTGDRLDLKTQLQPHHRYQLKVAGSVYDLADRVSLGIANAIPLGTSYPFSLSDRITLTLGSSSEQHLQIRVHDVAMIGPNLSTWGHDSVWITPSGGTPSSTTGFVRFEWQNLFRQHTGVSQSDQILKASFTLHPEFGNAQRLEIRRALQAWSDPSSGNDFNNNPQGAPTWRDASAPSKRWNQVGAGRLGSNGTSARDYNGSNDLAVRIDATLDMNSITHETALESPLVTDAFRFWFDNPTVDYGYAIRLAARATQDLKFERSENGLNRQGPALQITYLLPGATPRLEIQSTSQSLLLQWPALPNGWSPQSAPTITGPWSSLSETPSIQGEFKSLEMAYPDTPQYYRLALPADL